jgi:hypothetical protein
MHQVTVTGVAPHAGDIEDLPAVRREINDLIADKKQWALYIQAMGESVFCLLYCRDIGLKLFRRGVHEGRPGGCHVMIRDRWDPRSPVQGMGQCLWQDAAEDWLLHARLKPFPDVASRLHCPV